MLVAVWTQVSFLTIQTPHKRHLTRCSADWVDFQGPLLDQLIFHIKWLRCFEKLSDDRRRNPALIWRGVTAAREIQTERFEQMQNILHYNAQMNTKQISQEYLLPRRFLNNYLKTVNDWESSTKSLRSLFCQPHDLDASPP
jgi:magnesium chelatase family protein